MASDPPINLLPNGATFVPPAFYNLPGFGYANLQAQLADAMSAWARGAGVFTGNNVPKYNGLPGSDINGTFGGGFARMAPSVGGGLLGASAYGTGNPYNPFAGRGLLGGGGGGGSTPGGGIVNGGAVGRDAPPVLAASVAGTGDEAGRSYYQAPPAPPAMPANPTQDDWARYRAGSPTPGGTPPPVGGTPAPSAGGSNPSAPPPVVGVPPPYQNNWNPPANQSLLLQTLANQGPESLAALEKLAGSNLGMHQAINYYNAGGAGFDPVYSAVAANPGPYIAAGIARANGDGTYTILKHQDENQQWVPNVAGSAPGWAAKGGWGN